jgi:hypothetical protein
VCVDVRPGPTRPQDSPADCAEGVIPFRARRTTYVAAEYPAAQSVRPATARAVRTRQRVIRGVVVLEVAGRLSEALEDLDLAIRLALAEGPRGVVCDLSGVVEDPEPVAVEVLATVGRHVRDWPGIPVAVACPDWRVRELLAAHPLGSHLLLSASLFSAITEVLSTPPLAVERLHLAPHPTAPRASRGFVSRTLRGWQLGRAIPFASLVVSELVASSSRHVGTDLDVSLAWNLGALRLAVRDHGPAQLHHSDSPLDLYGRGRSVVAGLSRTLGFLPAADGGQVVWAVLDAPRPRLSARQNRSGHTDPEDSRELSDGHASPELRDGSGQTALRLWAGSSRPGALESIGPRRVSDRPSAGRHA